MAHTTCEMLWLKSLLMELGFRQPGPMPMHCDNQFAIYIAQNLVFHERTKHIEIDCHFIRNAWTKKVVMFQFTQSLKQLADLLTKAASPQVYFNLCNKLVIWYVSCLCSSLRGSVKLLVLGYLVIAHIYPFTLSFIYIL